MAYIYLEKETDYFINYKIDSGNEPQEIIDALSEIIKEEVKGKQILIEINNVSYLFETIDDVNYFRLGYKACYSDSQGVNERIIYP
jgi:hypothetical protein